MTDFDGLGIEDHSSLYGLDDHWSGEYRNHRKQIVAWNHVSPSQIENFVKCKRAWHFKSILKVPELQKGHQALGESFHLVLEKVPKGLAYPNRADTGASPEEWDRADQMAKIALPLLPLETPQISIKREHGISLDTFPGGPRMVGYIDLAIPPGIGWPALLIPTNEAIVGDYKTLSDFRYMKTPEELASSVQMMTYAKWAIEEWPSGLVGQNDPLPEHVRLVHLYARTKAPFIRSSIRHESALVSPAEINTFWNKTLDTVREMQQVALCGSADDVEANGALNGHCEAYGGCSYRDKCGIPKESGIKQLFQITKKDPLNMSGSAILDKIKAARAAASGQTPATEPSAANVPTGVVLTESTSPVAATVAAPMTGAPEQKTATVAGASSGPISGLMNKINAQGKGIPALGGSAAQAYGKEIGSNAGGFAGGGELGSKTVNTVGELMKLASGVVPLDAPPREQAIITRPGQAVEPTSPEEDEDEIDNTPISPNAPENQPIPEKPRRGRPTREEMAAREAAERKVFEDAVNAEVVKRGGGSSVPSDQLAKLEAERVALAEQLKHARAATDALREELAEAQRPQSQSAPVQQEGCTLYIDCFPVKGAGEGVVDFFEWVQPIAAAVAQGNGVADYRLIQYNSKGLLATHIRELVKAEGLPRAMTIPTYAAGADIALEILAPLAKRIIKKI